jgi:hypothetical protein
VSKSTRKSIIAQLVLLLHNTSQGLIGALIRSESGKLSKTEIKKVVVEETASLAIKNAAIQHQQVIDIAARTLANAELAASAAATESIQKIEKAQSKSLATIGLLDSLLIQK